jgi:peroxiredoxin
MTQAPGQAPDRWARRFGGIVAISAFMALVVGLVTRAPGPSTAHGVGVQVGQTAPDFTLRDLTGAAVRLKDMRGHPLALNFWFAACDGCRQEAPTLEKLYQAQETNGLLIIGINVADVAGDARQFVARNDLTYPSVLDANRQVAARYQVNAYPTTYFLDALGVIRTKVVGTLDGPAITAALTKLGLPTT